MAGLNGIKSLINLNAVREVLAARVDEVQAKILEALQYQGEEFVNKARLSADFTDRTGNLRSSIGYIILNDGKTVVKNFQQSEKGTDKKSGVDAAKKVATEVAREYPKGYVLIGVAGMRYAAAVESKGFDVITGSAPEDQQIKDLIGAIKI
jgi:hypothetical protein